MNKRLIAALTLAVLWSPASATTFRELSLAQLIDNAELGFRGAVTQTVVEARDGEPYTEVTFSVARPLVGELDESVTLSFYGGTLPNGRSVAVEGMPEFARGDEVLVLAYDAPYYSPIVGFSQGLWRATPDGFEDEAGRLLSLGDAGNLLRDGEGSDQNRVLDELEAELRRAQ